MEAVRTVEHTAEPKKAAEAVSLESEASMEELLEKTLSVPQLTPGAIVKGILVKLAEDEVLVDIGTKTEAVLYNRELSGPARELLSNFREGDEIPVYIVKPEDEAGQAVVSILRAQTEADWDRMEELFKTQEIFEVEVVGYNRGGLLVKTGMLQGFVPVSLLDPARHRNNRGSVTGMLSKLVGRKIKVKVVDVKRKQGRLILSEKSAMEEWRRERKSRLLRELEEGDICTGRVTGICGFGVFVDLGGAEGLIHISELSWRRISHPSEVVKVGEEVEVYVLGVDREKERISLSLKRLQPEPWSTVEEKYYVGQFVKGTVTKLTPFGAFVELEEGIEGLIHISELSFQRINHPKEVVKEGDVLRLQIISLDPVHRRMGLSLKRVAEYEKSSPNWRKDYEEYVKAQEEEE